MTSVLIIKRLFLSFKQPLSALLCELGLELWKHFCFASSSLLGYANWGDQREIARLQEEEGIWSFLFYFLFLSTSSQQHF